MKVSLTGLPNKLRGGAWPSSVRTVKRAVKSVNERDPYPMLLILSADKMHSLETATDKVEEGVGDGRSVYTGQLILPVAKAPNLLGNTRPSMVGTMGSDRESGRQSPKSNLSSDRGL